MCLVLAQRVDGCACVGESRNNQVLLRLAIGSSEARAPPILSHHSTEQADRVSLAVITESDTTARLATRVAIGARVEGM